MGKIYKWYRNGKLYQESYDPEGKKLKVIWGPNGSSKTFWYRNTVNEYEYIDSTVLFYVLYTNNNNDYHNDSGPARIEYYSNGSVRDESYYINNKLHRDGDKPAVIRYDKKGNILYQQFFKDNECYRKIVNGIEIEVTHPHPIRLNHS